MQSKVIRVDIDGTICWTPSIDGKNIYEKSMPNKAKITVINALFRAGHIIIYWTARGSSSGNEWTEFTEKQLDDWGCLRHGLEMGKPSYDLFIDDKNLTSLSAPQAFELGLLEL